MKLKISKTNIIKTVDEWKQFAPPMDKDKHWKEGRSAMSLAQFVTNEEQTKKIGKRIKRVGIRHERDNTLHT